MTDQSHARGVVPLNAFPRWDIGDTLKKKSGSQWHGRVVGFYSTDLTPIGYAIESFHETGSVQIYPQGALEEWIPGDE